MKKSLLTVITLSLLTASCGVISTSSTKYTYRSAEINESNVLSNKAVVDSKVDLSKKIMSTSSPRDFAKDAIEEAYYMAINNNNADFIVDPIFEITTSKGKTVAKLTGWAGRYSNSRTKVEAIRELSNIDILDVEKFNQIYNDSNDEPRKEKPSLLPKGLRGLLIQN